MIIEKLFKILLLGTILAFIVGCSPTSYAQRYKSGKKHKTTLAAGKKNKKKRSSKKGSSKKNSSGKNLAGKNSSKKNTSSTPRFSPENQIAEDDTLNTPDTEVSDEEDGEDLPPEKEVISVSQLVEKYVSGGNQYSEPSDSVNLKEKVIMEIIKYLDTPYKFGGVTSKGIDCSAFTRTVYNSTFSYELPRTAREQFQQGEEVDDISQLKFGDLIFFNTRRRVRPGHVGIYLGDNLFAHSSSRQGVMVSSLDMEYYNKRFMGGRRFENLMVK